jgi:hypothetical protein
MRYRDTGNVHMDFHLGTATTISYILEEYGMSFLEELFRRTARDVYRDILSSLQAGDAEPLLEHWTYYMDREGGEYKLLRNGETAVLEVKKCPAVAHLRSRGESPDRHFCLQTILINKAWSQDTPFRIETDVTGDGACRQTVRRIRAPE